MRRRPASASAMSACHVAAPANPSTSSPWRSWNLVTAPRVMAFAWPAFHCPLSSGGVFGSRQAKLPAGGATAASTCARREWATGAPDGDQVTGR